MVVKVVSDIVVYNVFEEFTTYTSKRDMVIVLCTISIPFLKDRHNMSSRPVCGKRGSEKRCGASPKPASFNTQQGMESGPDALTGLILLRSLYTPWTSTPILGIEGRKNVTRRGRYGGSVLNSKYRSELLDKNIGLKLTIR